jgi:hypothetical protein
MTASLRFSARYAEDVLREGVRAFVWRRLVREQKLTGAALLFVAIMLAWLVHRGDRSWAVGFMASALLVVLVMVVAVWRVHQAHALDQLRRMGEPAIAEFSLDDTGMTVESRIGASTVPWSGITEIWALPRSWLLFAGRHQFMTLPLDGVPAEALAMIAERTGLKPPPSSRHRPSATGR